MARDPRGGAASRRQRKRSQGRAPLHASKRTGLLEDRARAAEVLSECGRLLAPRFGGFLEDRASVEGHRGNLPRGGLLEERASVESRRGPLPTCCGSAASTPMEDDKAGLARAAHGRNDAHHLTREADSTATQCTSRDGLPRHLNAHTSWTSCFHDVGCLLETRWRLRGLLRAPAETRAAATSTQNNMSNNESVRCLAGNLPNTKPPPATATPSSKTAEHQARVNMFSGTAAPSSSTAASPPCSTDHAVLAAGNHITTHT